MKSACTPSEALEKREARRLLKMAQSAPLAEKIEQAIGLLRLHESVALRMSPNGYYVCDSYGKDSDCIVHLCKLAGVKHQCHHNVTSIDPPELQRFGVLTRPDTIRHRQRVALLTALAQGVRGPPTRVVRWCCADYKEHGGDGLAKVIGVRSEESVNRAIKWKQFGIGNNGQTVFVCPILFWTAKDVWDFHKQFQLPYCELYDQGFSRLGCVGCPQGGRKGRLRDFARWPLFERNWHRAVIAFVQKNHGIPNRTGGRRWFENLYDKGGPEAIWDWWMSDKGQKEKAATCQYNQMFSFTDNKEIE